MGAAEKRPPPRRRLLHLLGRGGRAARGRGRLRDPVVDLVAVVGLALRVVAVVVVVVLGGVLRGLERPVLGHAGAAAGVALLGPAHEHRAGGGPRRPAPGVETGRVLDAGEALEERGLQVLRRGGVELRAAPVLALSPALGRRLHRRAEAEVDARREGEALIGRRVIAGVERQGHLAEVGAEAVELGALLLAVEERLEERLRVAEGVELAGLLGQELADEGLLVRGEGGGGRGALARDALVRAFGAHDAGLAVLLRVLGERGGGGEGDAERERDGGEGELGQSALHGDLLGRGVSNPSEWYMYQDYQGLRGPR